jgi:biopolymer transport protein ExbD
MISISLQRSQTVKVRLPIADHALADFKSDVISIGIAQNGAVYLGTNVVEFARLDEELRRSWGRNSSNSPVFITADENTRHGDVARVLQHVRSAGFQKVSFVATTGGTVGKQIDQGHSTN